MTEIKAKVVLTDIEGTTTSISFVKDVLFPYAKAHAKNYLEKTWDTPATQNIVQELKNLSQYKHFQLEAGISSQQNISLDILAKFINYLIDKDLKVGPLKTLQGFVWAEGYANGSIKGHVYSDVPEAFKRWKDAGFRIAIYSSGSVKAQQLLFGQTEIGNLLPFICGHFDTAIGHKQEPKSYVNIAQELEVQAGDVVFLTDIVAEAEAARSSGMQTVILNRPGNASLTDDEKIAFTVVSDFHALKLVLK